MTISVGTAKKIGYKKETTFGTLAGTSGGKLLRRVTANFNLMKETYESNEIRTDRQVADYRHGRQHRGERHLAVQRVDEGGRERLGRPRQEHGEGEAGREDGRIPGHLDRQREESAAAAGVRGDGERGGRQRRHRHRHRRVVGSQSR